MRRKKWREWKKKCIIAIQGPPGTQKEKEEAKEEEEKIQKKKNDNEEREKMSRFRIYDQTKCLPNIN